MVKVSVIVPIYGVEKYINECLDSILAQTLSDIEIILVDDGSKDKCPQIIDEYAKKDNRIIAIHKENGGYGSAVNTGLECATGEYIGIVEPDDYIENDMYQKLYEKAKEFDCDIVKCGFYKYDSTRKSKSKINRPWKHRFENIEKFPTDKAYTIREIPKIINFHASIWSNIYKREFINKNNIRVNSTQGASYQDFPFMVECMIKAQRIAILPQYLYHWRVESNQNSSTKRSNKNLLIMTQQCEEVKKIIKENGCYDILKEHIYSHFFSANYTFFKRIENDYKKEYFDRFRNIFLELKDDKDFKYLYFQNWAKKVISYLLQNDYQGLNKFIENGVTLSKRLKNMRRKLISFRLSKNGYRFSILIHEFIQKRSKNYAKN